ncbi:MAG: DUF2238 domain-containing protein [Candidatus Thermoplasmatota archaeon]|nr:DUF2238 domain-containing protein [Euryarchaeota archaeon]MBU4071061.1 DUF2238 domain-containing protein [Candidatus Thermoplasmatota archaeon]MBU4143814.1 DUF2238 domain-containing protein [Candidatus Thermoplasmatota archaeon]MBU4591599.1 DUF2238 domain-containing protein [Candidatus Thermoplasmatota archaeon]
MEKVRWEIYLGLLLRIALIILAIETLFKGEYSWFIFTTFAVFLTFLPSILKRDFNVNPPLILDISITMSVFLHTIGGYLNFYYTVPYFDHLTHFISSVTIALIGVSTLYILNYHTKLVNLPPLGFGLFTIFFVMSMGVVWEFIEWGIDLAVGSQLQFGLQDTMLDLMFDAIAGLCVSIIAVLWLRKKKIHETYSLIEVGDIVNSIGYQRWKFMTGRDAKFKDRIIKSFKDPMLLNGILDDVVEKSKYISDIQKSLWKKKKDEME